MKLSMTKLSGGLLVLAATAVMLAAAGGSYNGPARNYNQGNRARANVNTLGRYQCQGYNCNNNNNNNRHPFGPYHTYAVRPKPAYYGGRGLYYYRGYARYPAGGRPYRPRHQPRYNNRGCYGPRCNTRYNRNSRRPARPQGYRAPVAHNLSGFRPVNVLVLSVPASKSNYQPANGNSNKRPYGTDQTNNSNSDGYNSRNKGPVRNAGGY